jgi:hypothetical protein
MTPSNVSPVVTKRQSAMTSLRASATIIVLRVPIRVSAVRARYHSASALSPLVPPTVCGQLAFGLTLVWNRPVQSSIGGP